MNIIQEIISGVAECPILIESDHTAMMLVAELAKENGMKYEFDELGTYSDKVVADFVSALEEFNEENREFGYELKWWDSEVESDDDEE